MGKETLEILKKYFDEQPGEIISDKGTVIGEHEGLMYYTYGQRQGLGIGGGHGTIDAPWYVSDKNYTRQSLGCRSGS